MLDDILTFLAGVVVLIAFAAIPALFLAEALGGIVDAIHDMRIKAQTKKYTPAQLREMRIARLEDEVLRGPPDWMDNYSNPEARRIQREYEEMMKNKEKQ